MLFQNQFSGGGALSKSSPVNMSPKVFQSFRDYIYQQCGISLGKQKVALVSARISKRMRHLNISSPRDYLQYVQNQGPEGELIHLLDSISTNVTHFFREGHHFEFISSRVREWRQNPARRLRFWSAGCSSGEEPYSLAMTLLHILDNRTGDLRILATDISTRILEQCISGRYDEQKAEQIPFHIRDRYMKKSRSDRTFIVGEQARNLITFRRLNLSSTPYPMSGPMDVIMCRNVMIYFDENIRERLVREFERLLHPGGFLIIGHSENLTGHMGNFVSCGPSIYQKVTN